VHVVAALYALYKKSNWLEGGRRAGFKSKTIRRTPRGMMARSVLSLLINKKP
jgi:hypothetical protein